MRSVLHGRRVAAMALYIAAAVAVFFAFQPTSAQSGICLTSSAQAGTYVNCLQHQAVIAIWPHSGSDANAGMLEVSGSWAANMTIDAEITQDRQPLFVTAFAWGASPETMLTPYPGVPALKTGDSLEASNGQQTKQYVFRGFPAVTSCNVGSATVSGVAPPGSFLHIRAFRDNAEGFRASPSLLAVVSVPASGAWTSPTIYSDTNTPYNLFGAEVIVSVVDEDLDAARSSHICTETGTPNPIPTATFTHTPTNTVVATATYTYTATATHTPTATATATATATLSPFPPTHTPTATATAAPATNTPTAIPPTATNTRPSAPLPPDAGAGLSPTTSSSGRDFLLLSLAGLLLVAGTAGLIWPARR